MPIAPGTHYVYTVQPSDTIYAIAQRYSISEPYIIESNALFPPVTDPNRIYPGQVLVVRTPGMTQHSTVQYQIQSGDTLYGITHRFHTTIDLVLGLNPLITDPNYLRVAQNILMPAFIYEVEPGDSLSRIAAKFGAPLGAIIEANRGRIGFSPDIIYPNYRLIIPIPTSLNIVVFEPLPGSTVRQGDMMLGYARAFEAVIHYQIRDSRDKIVTKERSIHTSAGAPSYGQFHTTIAFDQTPITERSKIWVYTRSARDGSMQDLVEIPVIFGSSNAR